MNKKQISLFGSKKTDDYKTPLDLYLKLDQEFKFDFDPCPYQSSFNGLEINWKKSNFVNPPYSKVKEFLKKAWEELDKGNAKVCVFLVFVNTDTKWFHEYIYNRAEIRFIKGRIKFIGGKYCAMRPSMLCILRSKRENP